MNNAPGSSQNSSPKPFVFQSHLPKSSVRIPEDSARNRVEILHEVVRGKVDKVKAQKESREEVVYGPADYESTITDVAQRFGVSKDDVVKQIQRCIKKTFDMGIIQRIDDFQLILLDDGAIRMRSMNVSQRFFDFKAGKAKVQNPQTKQMEEKNVIMLVNTNKSELSNWRLRGDPEDGQDPLKFEEGRRRDSLINPGVSVTAIIKKV